MSEEEGGHQESRDGESVRNLGNERTSRGEGWARHVDTGVKVDDDPDRQVHGGDESLADHHRPREVVNIPHLDRDSQKGGDPSERKEHVPTGVDRLCEGWVAERAKLLVKYAGLGSEGGSRGRDGDGDCEDGHHHARQADPAEDGDAGEGLDRGEEEGGDRDHSNEQNRACAVVRDDVQCDRDGEVGARSDEDQDWIRKSSARNDQGAEMSMGEMTHR